MAVMACGEDNGGPTHWNLATTRHWRISWGAVGTYRLDVTSTVGFQVLDHMMEDQPSLATTFSC